MKEQWYNKNIDSIKNELNIDLEKGLTDNQIKEKREKYGFNELQAAKKKTVFQKFLEQFKDFMIIILIIAAIISGIVGYMEGEGITDSIIILIV